jgi:hypothetical protein
MVSQPAKNAATSKISIAARERKTRIIIVINLRFFIAASWYAQSKEF